MSVLQSAFELKSAEATSARTEATAAREDADAKRAEADNAASEATAAREDADAKRDEVLSFSGFIPGSIGETKTLYLAEAAVAAAPVTKVSATVVAADAPAACAQAYASMSLASTFGTCDAVSPSGRRRLLVANYSVGVLLSATELDEDVISSSAASFAGATVVFVDPATEMIAFGANSAAANAFRASAATAATKAATATTLEAEATALESEATALETRATSLEAEAATLEEQLALAVAAATPEEGPNVALIAGASVGGVVFLILAYAAYVYRRKIAGACACASPFRRRDGASGSGAGSGSGFGSGFGSRFGSRPVSGSARRDGGFDDPATIDPSASRRDDDRGDVAPARARAFVSPREAGPPWACPACTYHNDGVDERCGACDGPRPARSVAPPRDAPVGVGASPAITAAPAPASDSWAAFPPSSAAAFEPSSSAFASEPAPAFATEPAPAFASAFAPVAAAPSLAASASHASFASFDAAAPAAPAALAVAPAGLTVAPAPASFEPPPREAAEERARLERLEADMRRLRDAEAAGAAFGEEDEDPFGDEEDDEDPFGEASPSEEDEDPFGEASSEDAGGEVGAFGAFGAEPVPVDPANPEETARGDFGFGFVESAEGGHDGAFEGFDAGAPAETFAAFDSAEGGDDAAPEPAPPPTFEATSFATPEPSRADAFGGDQEDPFGEASSEEDPFGDASTESDEDTFGAP